MSAVTVIAISMVMAAVVAYWTWLDREDLRHTIRAWLFTSSFLTLGAIFLFGLVGQFLLKEEPPERPCDEKQ